MFLRCGLISGEVLQDDDIASQRHMLAPGAFQLDSGTTECNSSSRGFLCAPPFLSHHFNGTSGRVLAGSLGGG
jgi:hypothetical protein